MISEVLKTYLLDNIGADCIETGLLYSQAVINAVCDVLEAKAAAMPLVVDPIRVAKDGTVLLHDTATATLKRRLLRLTADPQCTRGPRIDRSCYPRS
jgi:hydroxymethylpyrimidine/phosphomethylpyrimidine kinase